MKSLLGFIAIVLITASCIDRPTEPHTTDGRYDGMIIECPQDGTTYRIEWIDSISGYDLSPSVIVESNDTTYIKYPTLD